MKTFLLSALVVAAVEAGNSLKYATMTPYQGTGCKQAVQVGPETTGIYLMDTCVEFGTGSVYLALNQSKVTQTTYAAANCKGNAQITFQAALNTCGDYADQARSAIFTAAGQSFDQSCSLQTPPYEVVYEGATCNKNSGYVVISASGQTKACTTLNDKTSIQRKCDNGTVLECTYTGANCQGNQTCTATGVDANTCTVSDGNSVLEVCPGTNVADVCPAHKPSNKKKTAAVEPGVIAGVVIVIIIVIVVVVVIAFVFIKKNKASAGDSGLMDGSETTYGSA